MVEMKYIDAERLLTDLKNPDLFNVTDKILSMVSEQPTADVAEVKHGEWTANDYCYMEWNGDYTIKHAFSCSCCNRIMYNDSKTDYCPHCGAKMD